jgi:hypothetical protein
MRTSQAIETAGAVPAPGGWVRSWQHWAPYAAVAWSLLYAALGAYWAVSGRGFPYTPETASDMMEPLLGRFGLDVAWIVVMMAGLPAAAVGAAMVRGVRGRALRPLLITAGSLLTGLLLLLMTALNLLVKLGYLPYAVVSLFTGAAFGQTYLAALTRFGGRLPLLWPPRRPGGVAETEPGCALGPDRRLCGAGGPTLLHPYPLRLGAGVPAGDERGAISARSREWGVDLGRTLPGDLRPGGSGTDAWIGAALG